MTWLSMAAGILACLIAGCGGGSGSGTPAPVAGSARPDRRCPRCLVATLTLMEMFNFIKC